MQIAPKNTEKTSRKYKKTNSNKKLFSSQTKSTFNVFLCIQCFEKEFGSYEKVDKKRRL